MKSKKEIFDVVAHAPCAEATTMRIKGVNAPNETTETETKDLEEEEGSEE